MSERYTVTRIGWGAYGVPALVYGVTDNQPTHRLSPVAKDREYTLVPVDKPLPHRHIAYCATEADAARVVTALTMIEQNPWLLAE